MKIRVLSFVATALLSGTVLAQSGAELPEGAGKPIVQRMCKGCHSLKVVESKHATKEQWDRIVQQMVARGADGTDEEIATVIDYLATNFPPQAEEKPKDEPKGDDKDKPAPNPSASLLTLPEAQWRLVLAHWQRAARPAAERSHS